MKCNSIPATDCLGREVHIMFYTTFFGRSPISEFIVGLSVLLLLEMCEQINRKFFNISK